MGFDAAANPSKVNIKRRVQRAREAIEHAIFFTDRLSLAEGLPADRLEGREKDARALRKAQELIEAVELNLERRGW